MSENHFRSWLTHKDNQVFWQKALPSERLDKVLAKTNIQKSIAGNHQNQLLHGFIENKIASDYAWLIDYKLREVFKTLTMDEFKESSGFERKDKSSFRQRNYFEVRDHLEYFLKHDIQQHQDQPDSQLNAFKRWIDISSLLLKRHCYEGFLLICVNLQLVERQYLIDGLPECVRKNYQELCRLCSPDGNHKALRDYIKQNQKEHDFPPLLLGSHAIGILNESIELLQQRELVLKKHRKEIVKQIHRWEKLPYFDFESGDVLVKLRNERKIIHKKLKGIKENIHAQLQQRDNLINELKQSQKHTIKRVPDYLNQTYHRIERRFNKQAIELAKNADLPAPPTGRVTTSSTLYSKKLLPSFWNRRGKSSDNYWKDFLIPSCVKP